MKLDVNKYRLLIPIIYRLHNTYQDPLTLTQKLTEVSGCPITASGIMVRDLIGTTEELDNAIQKWLDFYNYDEVILLDKGNK